MTAVYDKAPESVVDLVVDVREQHHEELEPARIGVLMRDVAPKTGNRRVMGKARKVSPEEQAYMPFDFLIWFAADVWEELNAFQRRALVDHELCHCALRKEKPVMRQHDLDEFLVIIERYGFWWPFPEEAERVFQSRLGLDGIKGTTQAVQPDLMGSANSIFENEEEAEDA